MDREWGSKPGSGGAATAQNEAIDRRERLRRLALETIDLAKDPYFMRNHLGRYECFDVSRVSNLCGIAVVSSQPILWLCMFRVFSSFASVIFVHVEARFNGWRNLIS